MAQYLDSDGLAVLVEQIKTYVANQGGKINSIKIEGTTAVLSIDNDKQVVLPLVSSTTSGLMTSTMLAKLNGIAEGAQKNAVTGVKGNSESSYRIGNVNITKANIGLGNVDNTADSAKSVKYATTAGSASSATTAASANTATTAGKATNDSDGNAINTTYLKVADASSTYLSQTNASSTYLTKTSASSTYLTKNDASNTYLSKTTASNTYATQSDLSHYVDNTTFDSAISDVTAIANGKTKTYVISDAVIDGFGNSGFNSNNDSLSMKYNTGAKIKTVDGKSVNLSDLKIGDVILVTETNVPDRFVGAIDTTNGGLTLYKMETAKVDLSGYITAVSLSGKTLSVTKNGTTTTYTTQDTTYSAGTGISKSTSNAFSLATSGVTAGSYGPSANVTGNNNSTISVPYITVDTYGRVTSISNKTLTCKNTTYSTTSDKANLTSYAGGTTTYQGYLTSVKAVVDWVNDRVQSISSEDIIALF